MIGHTATRVVHLWLQSAPGAACLLRWAGPDGPAGELRQATDEAGVVRFIIEGLEPGTRYTYSLDLEGETVVEERYFRTRPLWRHRQSAPDATLIAGSCAYINDSEFDRSGDSYGGGYSIFGHMADEEADAMVWLGDNVYFRESDFDSRAGMADRYRHARSLPELQPLLGSTANYAIWDDHDYGPNNHNRSFVRKDTALGLFRQYWANPSYGLGENDGVFTHFSVSDVDVFLLDDRWFRDANQYPDGPGKACFGKRQLEWLKNGLLASQGTFRVVAGGGQFLNDYNEYEGWNRYPDERSSFLEWVRESGVEGLIFLSGDRHFGELLRLPDVAAYPLFEITTSPLTSSPWQGVGDTREAENPALVEGTMTTQRNYARLEAHGAEEDRKLTVTFKSSNGERIWSRTIRAADLRS